MLIRRGGAWAQRRPGAWGAWVRALAPGVSEAPGTRCPCRWPAHAPPSLPWPLLAEDAPPRTCCSCLTLSSPPRVPRNLWREVTRYLHLGDIDAATEQKRCLEEKQRAEERKRESLRTPWQPKYFIQEVIRHPSLGECPECRAGGFVWLRQQFGQMRTGWQRSWGALGPLGSGSSFGPGCPAGRAESLPLLLWQPPSQKPPDCQGAKNGLADLDAGLLRDRQTDRPPTVHTPCLSLAASQREAPPARPHSG